MPLYEYRCRECGVRYEKLIFRKGTAAPPCPSCAAEDVEKLFSVPSVKTGGASSPAGGMGPCGAPKASCGSAGFG